MKLVLWEFQYEDSKFLVFDPQDCTHKDLGESGQNFSNFLKMHKNAQLISQVGFSTSDHAFQVNTSIFFLKNSNWFIDLKNTPQNLTRYPLMIQDWLMQQGFTKRNNCFRLHFSLLSWMFIWVHNSNHYYRIITKRVSTDSSLSRLQKVSNGFS